MAAPTPLTPEERIGVAFIVEAAALSTMASFSLLIYLLVNALRASIPSAGGDKSTFFRSHLNYYFLSLLFADTVQGVGALFDIQWVSTGVVTEGSSCTAQGAFKQAGDVGVALSVLAITIHTFFALFFRWTPPDSRILPISILLAIWTFVILVVSLGYVLHSNTDYYGETGLWCWITEDFPTQRIVLEYLYLWIAAFVNILLYVPLWLCLRGNLVVDGWKISWQSASANTWARPQRYHMRIARLMLAYPLIYIITVLPTSVARFLAFSGYDVPFQATVFSGILFSSSGVFNVILFTKTRPTLVVPGTIQTRNRDADTMKSIEVIRSVEITHAHSPPPLHPRYPPRVRYSLPRGTNAVDMPVGKIDEDDGSGDEFIMSPRYNRQNMPWAGP